MSNINSAPYESAPKVSGPYNNGFVDVLGPAQASVGNPASGEKIYIGKLQAGTYVTDFDYVFDDFGTGVAHAVGFETVDVVASGTVIAVAADGTKITAASATYWFAAQDVAAAAGRVVSSARPVKFLVPVHVVATQAGAVTGTPKCLAIIKGASEGPL